MCTFSEGKIPLRDGKNVLTMGNWIEDRLLEVMEHLGPEKKLKSYIYQLLMLDHGKL